MFLVCLFDFCHLNCFLAYNIVTDRHLQPTESLFCSLLNFDFFFQLLMKENLDLKLTPYKVLATSGTHGIVLSAHFMAQVV